jgi:3-oxoadipate enol-lactonase
MTQTIHIRDDGEGFPIVWIHGFPLSSAMFEPQTRIAGYRHIRPDLPGFGDTAPREGEATMAGYARNVLEAMDALRIETAVVAGFSMGGYVAMQLLREAPQRVAALLLLDTRETADSEEGRAGRLKTAAEVEAGGTGVVIESMLPKMVARESLRPEVRRIMETASAQGVVGALRAMAARPDSAATLQATPVPTLIVVGDRDAITPPTDAERMKAMMQHAELAPIAHAAHMANYEAAEQVNHITAAFLERYLNYEKP